MRGLPDSVEGEPLVLQPLRDVERVSYQDMFLIEDLLTTKMTFVTGEPKAGKSLFVAGMVRALLEGAPDFLGLDVHVHIEQVVYCYTDDGADAELAERFAGTSAMRCIDLVRGYGRSESFWPQLVASVIDRGADLFILDTVLGSLGRGEDIASSLTAQSVIDRIRPISEAGIPVILVTHTPKGNGEGLSVASSVIGGRGLAGGARGVIAIRKSKAGGLVVETQVNRAKRDLSMPVQVERLNQNSEVPVWSAREKAARSRRNRSSETLDWRRDLAMKVVTEQPPTDSMRGLGGHYAGFQDKSCGTIRTALKELVRHEGEDWVLTPVLSPVVPDVAA